MNMSIVQILGSLFRFPRLHSSQTSFCKAVVLTFVVLATGCATTRTTTITLDPPLDNLAAQTPLPIKAGVYYSPEFSNFQYERDFLDSKLAVQLGSASVRLFDRVLRVSFKEVVRLDGIPAGLSPKPAQVDVIVEPRIEAFHQRSGFEGDSERSSVTYQLRLYDPYGLPIGVRFIRGKAARDKLSGWENPSNANLRDAADKVPGALRDMWSSYQSVRTAKAGSTPIDAARFEIQAHRAENPLQVSPDIRLPLVENGVVAISVWVRNNGVDPVLLRDHDFALVLPTGRTLAPAPMFAILQPFERQSGASDAVAAVAGSMLGILAGMSESAEQVERRAIVINMLNEKGFRDRMLRAGESAQAIVFFIPGDDVQAFSEGDLLVWLVDPDGNRTASTKVPVANLTYQPTKAVLERRQK